jgi:uncharacterized membrane protein
VLSALAILVAVLWLPDWRYPGAVELPPVEAYRGRVVAVDPDPFALPEVPDGGAPVDPEPFPSFPVDPLPPEGAPDDPFVMPEGPLRVLLLEGPDAGTEVRAFLGMASTSARTDDFRSGDEVVVTFTRQPEGPAFVAVSDRWRLPVLAVLAVVFVAAVVLVGRGQGVRALIALALTGALVIKVVVPMLLQGAPPVPLVVIVASLITVITITLTEGLGLAGIAAMLGTMAALLVTGLLSAVVSAAAQFSVAGAEDLVFLQVAAGDILDVRGLLLAAFILGALGVLDDVTVTQAATVDELSLQRGLTGWALWASALRIGRSHIAATINTLFLAYVGASLPLLVLFALAQQPATLTLNSEIVAVEVVRTLAGSIGIVLAVPLTTAVATLLVMRRERRA